MNRRALLNCAVWDPRQPPQSASRFGQHSAQPAQPPLMTDPADLVARALEILAEENDAWHARRGLNRPPRSIR
jgi:hypothetical protein